MLKLEKIVVLIIFWAICIGTLFFCSSKFVNTETAPKWYCFYFGMPVLIGLLSIFYFSRKKIHSLIPYELLLAIIPICCFIESLYGIGQYIGWFQSANGFRVTGSFDNPAGFAASSCAGAAFCFYFISNKNHWVKWAAIKIFSALGIAIVLSASRAGILGFVTILIFAAAYYLRINSKQQIILSIIILITLIAGLYFLKKDSADGRVLIWQCTWEMIKAQPLFGFGPGGFKANYMNYQAAYFETHPESSYSMLADNINRPFNEYLLLLVNYGVSGFVIFLVLVFFVWQAWKKNKNKTLLHSIAGWCLAGIAVFSLFSYPLTYPFVWIMGFLSVYIIIEPFRFSYHKAYNIGILIIVLLVLTTYYYSYTRMRTEMKWCEIAHKSLMGQTQKMLPQYKLLYKQLYNNELFLYNYAAELNVAGYYGESLKIAYECEKRWADYDLHMLIADNCNVLGQYDKVERHLKLATNMCPSRFIPLYKLTKLYNVTDRREEAMMLAKKIINKDVKIPSPVVTTIKNEMLQLIEVKSSVKQSQ